MKAESLCFSLGWRWIWRKEMVGGFRKLKGVIDTKWLDFWVENYKCGACVRAVLLGLMFCYEPARASLEGSRGRIHSLWTISEQKEHWFEGKLSIPLSCLPEAAAIAPKTHSHSLCCVLLYPQTGAWIRSQLSDKHTEIPWGVPRESWLFKSDSPQFEQLSDLKKIADLNLFLAVNQER